MGAAAPQLTDSVMQFVTNMRGDVLGSLGLAFLVYTVITTIQKVEDSFNFVWRVERPRGLARRFTEYLSAMIVGPILLAVMIGLLASARHSPFVHWVDAVPPLAWAMGVLGDSVPYGLVTLVFTFMYACVPNTRVRLRPALIGGVSAGIIWALVGGVYTEVIVYSSRMVAVYTGFAVVLTTLIWVYLSWLILLIGAKLAFYVQCPQYLRHGHDAVELSGCAREQAALSVMYLIGLDYLDGKTRWTGSSLAAELDVPGTALAPVLGCLERRGLIVATERESFVPGRDPAGIELRCVIDAVRTGQAGRLPIDLHCLPQARQLMEEVESSIRDRLGGRTLRQWIDGG
jgi:membrane protein